MSLQERPWRIIVTAGFLVAFVGWTMGYVWGHRDDFVIIADVSPVSVFTLYMLFLGSVICNGLYTRDVLRAFHVRLRFQEWLSLSVATSAVSFVLPFRSGAGFRAMYLKTRYQFSLVDFLSSLSAMYLMYFTVSGGMGTVGMLMLWRQGQTFDLPLAVIFITLMLTSATCMLWRFPPLSPQHFPWRYVASIVNGWALLRAKRGGAVYLMVYTTCDMLVALLREKVEFTAYGVELSWGEAMFQAAGQSIALLASLTPGSLGIAEMMSIYMGQSLHYTASQALMVQALLRVVSWTTLLVLAPVALRWLHVRSLKPLARKVSPDTPHAYTDYK